MLALGIACCQVIRKRGNCVRLRFHHQPLKVIRLELFACKRHTDCSYKRSSRIKVLCILWSLENPSRLIHIRIIGNVVRFALDRMTHLCLQDLKNIPTIFLESAQGKFRCICQRRTRIDIRRTTVWRRSVAKSRQVRINILNGTCG